MMRHRLFRSSWVSALLPLSLFALLIGFTEYGIRLEKQRLVDEEQSRVLLKASTIRAQLEGELNATLHITTGLTGYIAINPGLNGDDDMAKMLATLFQYGKHLRNIGLAPGNIIRHVYPLTGNEAALGLDYRQSPRQWPAVKRAIESRSTVLAGPLKLVQGGHGLISRTPVFLEGGDYWGILSLVIDSDSLFRAAGLLPTENAVRFALRGKDGLGRDGNLFFGDAGVFQQSPLLLNLAVPGGIWQMAAVPQAGWGAKQGHLHYYRLVGLLISLLLSVLVWMTMADRRAIKHLALHDPLTGLANRRLFDERLSYTLSQKERHQSAFSLLYIDLDDFKPINDKHGHKIGDQVLREAALRMKRTVRHEDTVARIGGDEFMIILPATGDKVSTMHVAEELLQKISLPYSVQGEQLVINTSIGVSLYPQSGTSEEALIRAADHAMYRAKNNGKRQICFDQDNC